MVWPDCKLYLSEIWWSTYAANLDNSPDRKLWLIPNHLLVRHCLLLSVFPHLYLVAYSGLHDIRLSAVALVSHLSSKSDQNSQAPALRPLCIRHRLSPAAGTLQKRKHKARRNRSIIDSRSHHGRGYPASQGHYQGSSVAHPVSR